MTNDEIAPACPVGRVVYGDRPCDGPGSYYCDGDLWHSACRAYYEQTVTTTAAPPALTAGSTP